MKNFAALCIILILTGVGDIITTTYGVKHVDGITESNKSVATAMDYFGVLVGHLLLKVAAVTLVVILAIIAPDAYSWVTFIPAIFLWGFATIWNIFIIL